MVTMSDTILSQLPLKTGTWALDTNHVRVGFAIRHLGVARVRGLFSSVDARLVVGTTPESSSVEATIDIASLDTGNADRDAHVLSPELLDVATRPAITFRSTTIAGSGEDWTLDGDLTIGAVTRPVRLTVEFGGVAEFFDGTRHAGFEARGEIRRKDFGIDFGPVNALLGDVVKLEIDLEFIEPA